VPAQAQPGTQFTRRELIGTTIFAGRNPADEFFLNIDRLRVVATNALQLMNLRPA
jgi:hypothetical protein